MNRTFLVVLVVLAGCKRPLTEEEDRLQHQAKLQTELIAEIKALHADAKAPDAPLEPAIELAKKLFRLGRDELAIEVKRGRMWATAWEDSWALLDKHESRTDLTPTDRSTMEEVRGYLMGGGVGARYKPEEASKHFTKCMQYEPRWECFDGQGWLLNFARSDTIQRAALESCAIYSRVIADDVELWVRVIKYCIERNDGNRDLPWNTAKADVERYDRESARLEQEEKDAKEAEERRREQESREREQRQRDILDAYTGPDDSKRKDKCERCRAGTECKTQFNCMSTGIRDGENNLIRYCGSPGWGMRDTQRACE